MSIGPIDDGNQGFTRAQVMAARPCASQLTCSECHSDHVHVVRGRPRCFACNHLGDRG